jgi:hypothetical protein
VTAGRSLLADLARRTAVVLLAVAVPVVAALPDLARPVLVLGGLTIAAGVVAAVTAWRWAGTCTVMAATLTVLLAGALDASAIRPLQLLAAAGLLVALLAALAGGEETRPDAAHAVTVARAPWPRRVGPVLLALISGSIVAITSAQDVVPSVALVLAGLAAAVTALVVAAGVHRP